MLPSWSDGELDGWRALWAVPVWIPSDGAGWLGHPASLVLYFFTTAYAGRMRERHKIEAPAMTGHPDFERANRVQANTLENLVPFLAALWFLRRCLGGYTGGALGRSLDRGRVLTPGLLPPSETPRPGLYDSCRRKHTADAGSGLWAGPTSCWSSPPEVRRIGQMPEIRPWSPATGR